MFYAYIRVSTHKQGEPDVSLQEQRDAITRYAGRHGITIAAWFEEELTAARYGRPAFSHMMEFLRMKRGSGVLMHKIDRAARNLRDWADIEELIDTGVNVQFVNESLDLSTRGGRLTADIHAVVAAEYISNLQEEARKGLKAYWSRNCFPSRLLSATETRALERPIQLIRCQGPWCAEHSLNTIRKSIPWRI